MFQLIYRSKEILEEEGPKELAKSTGHYLGDRKSLMDYRTSSSDYQKNRIDNDKRWSFIKQNLDSQDTTLLDIGCAEGFFTAKAVDQGLLSIGIDNKTNRLEKAQNKFGFKPMMAFMRKEMTPKNITKLPSMDVVLLLAVYHHWVRQYGPQDAKYMLKTIAEKANKIFYEPPGHVWLSPYVVRVTATDTDTGEQHNSTVTAKQRFSISQKLPPGEYEIVVSAKGYESSDPTTIRIGKSGVQLDHVELQVSNGSVDLFSRSDKVEANIGIDYHYEYIRSIFGDSVEITDSITVPWMHWRKSDRADPVLALDTARYDNHNGYIERLARSVRSFGYPPI